MIARCKCDHPINVLKIDTYRGVELMYRSARGIQAPLTTTCPECGAQLPDCLLRVPRQTSEALMLLLEELDQTPDVQPVGDGCSG